MAKRDGDSRFAARRRLDFRVIAFGTRTALGVGAMPTPPRARVLLAEDDVEMRRLMALTLRAMGVDVDEVGDGLELLQRMHHVAANDRPDLIVSDVRMPGSTGLDVLRVLRRDGITTPFVLTTAFADPELREAASRFGAAAVLDKPFAMGDLRAAVRTLLATGTAS